jgi:hypothetical protein
VNASFTLAALASMTQQTYIFGVVESFGCTVG